MRRWSLGVVGGLGRLSSESVAIVGVAGMGAIPAVDAEGAPGDIRVLRSPDSRLSDAALEAARQWRWEPARTTDGKALPVYFTLTFNFKLQ